MERITQHAFDTERKGTRLTLRVSLHNDAIPPGGPLDPPFRWEDVLDAPRPGDVERGPPAWCEPAGEILSTDARVACAVLVRLIDGRVDVEDRLALTARTLSPIIETERAAVGLMLEEARTNAEERALAAAHPVNSAFHRAFARILGALRAVTRWIASAPDAMANAAHRAFAFLSTADGRRRFRAGLTDPHGLSGEQKAVTLFVGVSGILLGLALAHVVVTLVVPDLAREWRTVFFLFLYGFVTSVGPPLPVEPVLLGAAMKVGAWMAIATTLVAKVLAAWMVFFLGDAIGDRLHERARTRPWLTRALEGSERFAKRFGTFAVALFIATPGLPDFIALYIFGSLHMRLSRFLLGVAIGGAVLYTAATFGLMALLF